MAVEQLTNEQARKTLEHILQTDEFSQNHLLEQIRDFIRHLFAGTDPGRVREGTTGAGFVFEGLLVLGGIILIVYLIRTVAPFWNTMVKNVECEKSVEQVLTRSTSAEILIRAEKEASQGEYRRALRDLYLAVLMELDHRGLIRYQAAKTNSEYLREISKKAANLKEPFRSMVNLFEYKWYGLEKCSSEDFQKGRELYTALLKDGSHG
ncbi:MAG: hypothetical protein H6Q67_437 [Firmicutes bacterium]|nr:hypothetical protein [Bacillota bacterium]